MQRFISWLPDRLQWAPHNLIAHPLSEIVYWFTSNADGLSGWLHDITIPSHSDEDRG